MIKIYTDGACKGNPGVGGWGAIIMHNEKNIELFGGENDTTNNRMAGRDARGLRRDGGETLQACAICGIGGAE